MDFNIWNTKKPFSSFHFSVLFQQKIRWGGDQWFHNASNYFEIAYYFEHKNADGRDEQWEKEVETKEE